jgi:hypothetical protein
VFSGKNMGKIMEKNIRTKIILLLVMLAILISNAIAQPRLTPDPALIEKRFQIEKE